MKKGTPLSELLRARIRSYTDHRYKLALHVGVSPTTLSAWQNRVYNPPLNDPHALKLAEVLGVPVTEAFATAEADHSPSQGNAPAVETE